MPYTGVGPDHGPVRVEKVRQGMAKPGTSASVASALANARRLVKSSPEYALRQAQEVLRAEPNIAEAYILLAAAHRALGNDGEADQAEKQGIACAQRDPVILRVQEQIEACEYKKAGELIDYYLADTPNDPVAVHLRAKIQGAANRTGDAVRLLERALSLAPGYDLARRDLEIFGAANEPMEASIDLPEVAVDRGDWFTDQTDAEHPSNRSVGPGSVPAHRR